MPSVEAEPALARICDLPGRSRGVGFFADGHGTLLTSHEAVDGLARLVVYTADGRSQVVPAEQVTSLPEWDLALIHTPGPSPHPLAIGGGEGIDPGAAVTIRPAGWDGTVRTGPQPATYAATDRFHVVPAALRLSLEEPVASRLRLNAEATGSPVLDARTGVVLGVLTTALHTEDDSSGFVVPLRAAARAAPGGPLDDLLRRNGARAAAFGSDLNLAGALRAARSTLDPAVAAQADPEVEPPGTSPGCTGREEAVEELRAFDASSATVLALVGPPGTGRSTSLAAYAARRLDGEAPAPTVWLRGADLRGGDSGIVDAVGRALRTAAGHDARAGAAIEAHEAADPEALARVASESGRPLLVLLDAPEEMPPALAAALPWWCARTAGWLQGVGARLALACRPEFWEHAGRLFPPEALHARGGPDPSPGIALPPCHRVGDLPTAQAAAARTSLGIGGRIAPADQAHPLSLRMLARIRAAQPPGAGGAPDREQIFTAHLALSALHIAVRLMDERRAPARTPRASQRPPQASRRARSAGAVGERVGSAGAAGAQRPRNGAPPVTAPVPVPRSGPEGDPTAVAVLPGDVLSPPPPAGEVRRLAARVTARIHEAARCSLGPVLLPPVAFDRLFPRSDGWARAVLDDGLLLPVGAGYRFADEEFADWLQGRHLDLDTTVERILQTLPRSPEPATDGGEEPPPIPRHRIGPVVAALLRLGRERGADALRRRLQLLVDALPGSVHGDDDRSWWACHLLGEVLLRLPDAAGQLGVIRQLAERIGSGRAPSAPFGPWFWQGIALPTFHRVEMLRLLLPADRSVPGADRYLTTVARLLAAEPHVVQPLLCRWFDDTRALAGAGGPPRSLPGGSADGAGTATPQGRPPADRTHRDDAAVPRLTVAAAAQALLHTHRGRGVDRLVDMLVDSGHPRGEELLAELLHDEPGAMCRAVLRWAGDDRPARRSAASAYALRAWPHARSRVERGHLTGAAEVLLSRHAASPAEGSRALVRESGEDRPGSAPSAPGRAERDAAYQLLLRDPGSRARHLPAALRYFTGTGALLPADGLADALTASLATHPVPVLAAFRRRLLDAGTGPADHTTLLSALAEVRSPALARRISLLVAEYADRAAPLSAEPVARYVAHRLRQGASARAVLHPLVAGLLRTGSARQRSALARVLATEAGPPHRALLELLLPAEGGDRSPSDAAPLLGPARVPEPRRQVPAARPGDPAGARRDPHPPGPPRQGTGRPAAR